MRNQPVHQLNATHFCGSCLLSWSIDVQERAWHVAWVCSVLHYSLHVNFLLPILKFIGKILDLPKTWGDPTVGGYLSLWLVCAVDYGPWIWAVSWHLQWFDAELGCASQVLSPVTLAPEWYVAVLLVFQSPKQLAVNELDHLIVVNVPLCVIAWGLWHWTKRENPPLWPAQLFCSLWMQSPVVWIAVLGWNHSIWRGLGLESTATFWSGCGW